MKLNKYTALAVAAAAALTACSEMDELVPQGENRYCGGAGPNDCGRRCT